jgi:hypothetical protein
MFVVPASEREVKLSLRDGQIVCPAESETRVADVTAAAL